MAWMGSSMPGSRRRGREAESSSWGGGSARTPRKAWEGGVVKALLRTMAWTGEQRSWYQLQAKTG